MKPRIGFGYDVHQLKEGHDLIIGGVKIQSERGAVGHSDADVLVHAICDALLGAANLGDIGLHFPDKDDAYKNIDSCILLKKVNELLQKDGFQIGNIDSTICLQEPKLQSYIPAMKERLSEVLGVDAKEISIKATTTEKLGLVGRGEGISAYAVALIRD